MQQRLAADASHSVQVCPLDSENGLRSRNHRPFQMSKTGAKLNNSAKKPSNVLAHALPSSLYIFEVASGRQPGTSNENVSECIQHITAGSD